MWLYQEFMDDVEELYVPAMGSEVMAPLLYSLIRFVRARTVLEAGMGYTTPFIAKALQDNEASFRAERAALVEKTAPYLDDIDAMGPSARIAQHGPEKRGLSAIYESKTSLLGERRTDWMFADPAALLRPGYYLQHRSPRLHCIDNIATASSSARLVQAKLVALGLSEHVSEHRGDFWSYDFASAGGDAPFDVVWLDLPLSVRNLMSLLNGPHWDLVNPDGGLLIIHDMLTHGGGQMLVKNVIKASQQKRFADFEFVGLLEPHRVVQNSFVMIRKLTGYTDKQYEKDFTAPADSTFELDARALLAEQ